MNKMTDKDLHTKQLLNKRLGDAASSLPVDRGESMRHATAQHNSPLARLTRRYLISGIIGLTAPVWIILLKMTMPASDLMFWSYVIYTVGLGIVNCIMYSRLRHVPELMSKPVVEAQRSLLHLDQSRRLIKYIGWVLGIPILIMIFSELARVGQDVIWGGVIGGIIGGIIGLTWEIKNRRQMRALIRAFEP